ncbi:protein sprouty [Harmonia axyridis]|uniref:Sprouty n=1 Tax=Harmonia axyridis TaxID=115357 RepID=A0A1X9J238_HARAX|nr:protein sprouty [Harmonia axyridis]XP_045479206.1 protein sprouty [Harmonia axyridis]APR62723.1 sprouty [Harmonia axyridis]
MDSHGGQSMPRAHRPRAPMMSTPVPLTAPLGPLRPPPPVTLTAPRPDNERVTNEYVETPFRATPPSPPPTPPRAPRPRRLDIPPPLPPITKQPPTSLSFQKERAEQCMQSTSIICSECGRCRCASCQRPRPLPEKWVCGNCLVSADTIIDYTSCLCCVKGLFYHCSETDGGAGDSCADNPCGCGPNKRAARWGCLGALACVLPCLWLYWPLRGCKRVVEVCYAQHSRSGCRCQPTVPTPEKRLLDSSPDL